MKFAAKILSLCSKAKRYINGIVIGVMKRLNFRKLFDCDIFHVVETKMID